MFHVLKSKLETRVDLVINEILTIDDAFMIFAYLIRTKVLNFTVPKIKKIEFKHSDC